MHNRLANLMLVAAALVGSAAFAQAPKPRVMVIMDTSKSMKEKPAYSYNGYCPTPAGNGANSDCVDVTGPTLPDGGTSNIAGGGDFDPVAQNVCNNKFCAAKSVIYNVIPNFTDSAYIGLTTYYQYLVKADTTGSQTATCLYDVLVPPNTVRQFTSVNDFTGGGAADVCAGATTLAGFNACSKTANYYFPDSAAGGTNTLTNICKQPTGVAALASASTTPTSCALNAPDCYQLVKQSTTTLSTTNCTVNTLPAPTSLILGSAGVCAAGNYTSVVGGPTVMPSTGTYSLALAMSQANLTALGNGTLKCGTAAMPVSPISGATLAASTGVNGEHLTSNPTSVGSGTCNSATSGTACTTGWLTFPTLTTNTGGSGSCSTTSPCDLYLTSMTPTVSNANRYWYMFYDPSWTAFSPPVGFQAKPGGNWTTYDYGGYPGTLTSGMPNYLTSTASSSLSAAAILTGTKTGVPQNTSCLAATGATMIASVSVGGGSTGSIGRYTSNTLAAWGINTPATTLASSSMAPTNLPATNDSPGWASNTFTCAAGTGTGTGSTNGMPCDIKVTGDTPTLGTPTTSIGKSATAVASAAGNLNYTLYATNTANTNCPSIGTLGAIPVGYAWIGGTPAVASCTAGTPCTFTSTGGPTSSNTVASSCASPTVNSYDPATAPTTCAVTGGTLPYTAGSPVSTSVKINGVPGATCPAATTTNGSAGMSTFVAASGGTLNSNGCPSSGNCKLGTPSSVSGTSATASTYVNTAPTGFTSTTPTVVNLGTFYQNNVGIPSTTPSDCTGGTNTLISMSGANCPGGSGTCTVKVLGMQVIGTAGSGTCTAEAGATCYSCQYQQLRFDWSTPTVNCTYPVTKTPYTLPNTVACNYSVKQWDTAVSTHTCQYQAAVVRNEYTVPASATCSYQAVQTTLQYRTASYTYSYLTKGTELIGRGAGPASPVGAPNNCSNTPATGTPASGTQCPQTVAGCSGITFYNSNFSSPPSLTNATCQLRYGGGTTSGQSDLTNTTNNKKSLSIDGAWQNYASNSVQLPSSLTAPSCEASLVGAALPASATVTNTNTTPTGFCATTGMAGGSTYSLLSDWYDPSLTNTVAALQTMTVTTSSGTVQPFAGKTLSLVTNTASKKQGFGAAVAPAIAGSGDLNATAVLAGSNISYRRPTFVPIPGDATYNATTQATALRAAAYPCVPPSTAVNADGTLTGGACLSDFATPNGGSGDGDYTPLYGALKNTYDYMLDRFQNDEAAQGCRGYYIIMATDGLENTPRKFNQSDLQSLVSSFRNTTSSLTTPDVKTYVIGFGSGASGSGALDAIAAAGGTSFAYSASNQATLAGALNSVFAAITQGTQSRSKPAIGTDGTRLYAAQYVVSPPGPDSYGLLTAYAVSSTGIPAPVWEFSTKLDDPGAANRTIKVALNDSHNNLVVTDLTSGNADLTSQLTACSGMGCPGWPATNPPTATDIVNFMKKAGQNYNNVLLGGQPVARSSASGPIVNSSPVIISKSPFDLSYAISQGGYQTFQSTTATTRGTRVMFQSSDGFAHSVIDNSSAAACSVEANMSCPNGTEAWALIPGLLAGNRLANNSQPNLLNQLYQPVIGTWNKLLNNTFSVADVCGDNSQNSANCLAAQWHTIAIGSQREGGRGIYALDVTDGTVPPNSSGTNSKFLWSYADGNLGRTYSVPAIGQVSESGKSQFVAIFGGGLADGTADGKAVYVLNALSGRPIDNSLPFTQVGSLHQAGSWLQGGDFPAAVLARPATWREPGFSYIDSAYLGIGPQLFAMRFADSLGVQWDDFHHWRPDMLWDPTDPVFAKPALPPADGGTTVAINSVNIASIYDGGVNTLVQVGTLPLPANAAPTILNRPKLGGVLDPTSSVPDLYVGTGDIVNPSAPSAEFSNGNYFYAIHDFNNQNYHLNAHGNCHGKHGQHGNCVAVDPDGLPLWVVKFPGQEQVVSEPVFLSSCIVVATYTPPQNAGAGNALCTAAGDATLYGFHPLTGALVNCLLQTSATAGDGGVSADGGSTATTNTTATSVVKCSGCGIISDLSNIGDNVYFQTSNQSGVQLQRGKPTPLPSIVRSYRRLK